MAMKLTDEQIELALEIVRTVQGDSPVWRDARGYYQCLWRDQSNDTPDGSLNRPTVCAISRADVLLRALGEIPLDGVVQLAHVLEVDADGDGHEGGE